uniref:Uncharacterized protein n=1 Tax=Sipha flava TaxID=143950 RepID=A0A2S2Q5K3_9HEMI
MKSNPPPNTHIAATTTDGVLKPRGRSLDGTSQSDHRKRANGSDKSLVVATVRVPTITVLKHALHRKRFVCWALDTGSVITVLVVIANLYGFTFDFFQFVFCILMPDRRSSGVRQYK